MSRKTKARKKKQKVIPERKVPVWIAPLILVGLVIGTFLLRTLPSWDKVFVSGEVWFRGVDPWYHMRLVDNMMVNFPHPLEWDMSILFPHGMNVGYFPLLSWIITIPGQIFNYEVVGALLPPILGALILIPIFFICKTLWKDWVGLIACTLVMLLPTELFHRTLLGFTDHHVLEVLFSSLTILFLVLYTKRERLRWIILGGISLGLFMSSWTGGLLLVAPILLWFLITAFSKLRKEQPIKEFCIHVSILLGLGLVVFLPNVSFVKGLYPHAITLGLITISPIVLYWASQKWYWKKLLKISITSFILMLVIFQFALPQILELAGSALINPATTIQEAMFSHPNIMMAHYGVSFLLCIGGLIFAFKKKENLLIIIWCTFMLILTISQRRWSYYFAINNAILAGYFIYLIHGWIHKTAKVAVVVVVCIILLATSISGTKGIANLPNVLTNGWYNSCAWLRENTPEIEEYYDLNVEQVNYGILSWWDYGNWITRIGHRTPCSNPMNQHLAIQWQIFLAPTEEEANNYLEGINYIMVDYPMVSTKLYAIVTIAPEGTVVDENTFIVKLWNETATTWEKVYQYEEVKIFARSET